MIKNIRFDYLGNIGSLLIPIVQLSYEEHFMDFFIFPPTDDQLKMISFNSKSTAWRRYDLLLDLFGCLDADFL